MGNKRENILAALELVLAEILRVDKMNVWISVKDRSIASILQSGGVNKNYSAIIVDELKKLGLVEGEGERSGMRYKIISNVIPDVSRLALTIYNRFSKKIRPTEGYPESKKSDLFPLIPKKNKSENYDPKTTIIRRKITLPSLGDIRYIIYNNRITEGKIVGMYYHDENDKEIKYQMRIANPEYQQCSESIEEDEPASDQFIMVFIYGLKELFENPESAASYLVRKVIRYK
nr:MAG TPA: hypothetical protein [Caudoviricetes sp.]